ncbi:BMC domain-containing protein [candidate division KSB1 bacterium]
MEIYQEALGLLETRGLVAAIEGLDTMLKAAKVTLVSKEYSGGALVIMMIRGEVGAVKAAVTAGQKAAEKVGEFKWTHIIPRPDQQTKMLLDYTPVTGELPPAPQSTPDLDSMTVTQLRNLARSITELPLKGRHISTANKTLLVKTLKAYFKESSSGK